MGLSQMSRYFVIVVIEPPGLNEAVSITRLLQLRANEKHEHDMKRPTSIHSFQSCLFSPTKRLQAYFRLFRFPLSVAWSLSINTVLL
jgi:hypothetical protein